MPIYHFVFNVIGDLFGFGFVFAKCELRKECDFKIVSNEGRTLRRNFAAYGWNLCYTPFNINQI